MPRENSRDRREAPSRKYYYSKPNNYKTKHEFSAARASPSMNPTRGEGATDENPRRSRIVSWAHPFLKTVLSAQKRGGTSCMTPHSADLRRPGRDISPTSRHPRSRIRSGHADAHGMNVITTATPTRTAETA